MTTIYTLTNEWQKIGEGSSAVEMLEGLNAWLYVEIDAPEGDTEYRVLTFKAPNYRYSGNLNIYAKRASNSSDIRTRLSVNPEGNTDSVELADDAFIDLPESTTGNGFAQLLDNEAWVQFSWSQDGTPTLMINSANVADSDTDDKLCLFANENGVRIKNRLGATKELTYQINYI
jgi:hypothetical protein